MFRARATLLAAVERFKKGEVKVDTPLPHRAKILNRVRDRLKFRTRLRLKIQLRLRLVEIENVIEVETKKMYVW